AASRNLVVRANHPLDTGETEHPARASIRDTGRITGQRRRAWRHPEVMRPEASTQNSIYKQTITSVCFLFVYFTCFTSVKEVLLRHKMARLASDLLQQPTLADGDAAVGGLAHVIDGESGHRDGGQCLHFDA